MLNPERLKALEMWLQETDVKLTQVNGQRKYGGPPDGMYDWNQMAYGAVNAHVFSGRHQTV